MKFLKGSGGFYEYNATIRETEYGEFALSVDLFDPETGKRHPDFDHIYTTERGARNALKRRYPGVHWREY